MSNNKITPAGIWTNEFTLRPVEWTDKAQNTHIAHFIMTLPESYNMDACEEKGADLYDYLIDKGTKLHNGVQNGKIIPAHVIISANGHRHEEFIYNGKYSNQDNGLCTQTLNAEGKIIKGQKCPHQEKAPGAKYTLIEATAEDLRKANALRQPEGISQEAISQPFVS